jgi:hypothetical protein
MEKKIIIKLFEEFKSDRDFSKNRTIEIIDFIITNYKYDFKRKIHTDLKVGKFVITSNNGYENPGEMFNAEVSIRNEEVDFDEQLDFEYTVINNGGKLETGETQLQPAEYSDDNYDINIKSINYSKYFIDDNGNDIDFVSISDMNNEEINTKSISLINELMNEIL